MNSGMLWFYVCYFFLKIHLLWYFHFNFCVNFKGQSAGWIDAWRPIEDRMTKIYFQLYKGAFIQNLEKSVLKVQFIINEYGSCIVSWLCNYLYLILQIICKFDIIEKCIGLYNLFFRIDQKGCARFCYWWIKWRRVQRWILENCEFIYRLLTQRKTTLFNGSRVTHHL